MRYSGGKGKIAGKLAEFILSVPHERIIEPFCGGLSMTAALQPNFASDLSRPVITLVEAVRSGWRPPAEMSEDAYKDCQRRRDDHGDPLVAFAGHCCSWGGKWFGGLARGHKRQREPVRAAAITLVRRVLACPGTKFVCGDYRRLVKFKSADLVYCDPPYQGTTNGYACSDFEHAEFWDWVRARSGEAHVVVSEYAAPEDFQEVLALDCATNVRRQDANRRVEKLFMLRRPNL